MEFELEDSVGRALALAGTKLDGHELLVKTSEAEKNIIHSAQTGGGAITNLFFKPTPEELDEDDLRMLFEAVGDVESIEIRKNNAGQRLGYGYVKYRRADDAKKALLKINNVDLAGIYKLKLGMWFEDRVQQHDSMQASSADVQQVHNGGLEDYEGQNFSESAQTRAIMIAKFNSADQLPQQQQQQQIQQLVTQNILLTNMFDPETYVWDFVNSSHHSFYSETEPNFEQDIKQDVVSECTRFGTVVHCWVDKNSKGHVYVRFDTTESARRAQQALHGRWFAKKMISVTYIGDTQYFTKFPELIL